MPSLVVFTFRNERKEPTKRDLSPRKRLGRGKIVEQWGWGRSSPGFCGLGGEVRTHAYSKVLSLGSQRLSMAQSWGFRSYRVPEVSTLSSHSSSVLSETSPACSCRDSVEKLAIGGQTQGANECRQWTHETSIFFLPNVSQKALERQELAAARLFTSLRASRAKQQEDVRRSPTSCSSNASAHRLL